MESLLIPIFVICFSLYRIFIRIAHFHWQNPLIRRSEYECISHTLKCKSHTYTFSFGFELETIQKLQIIVFYVWARCFHQASVFFPVLYCFARFFRFSSKLSSFSSETNWAKKKSVTSNRTKSWKESTRSRTALSDIRENEDNLMKFNTIFCDFNAPLNLYIYIYLIHYTTISNVLCVIPKTIQTMQTNEHGVYVAFIDIFMYVVYCMCFKLCKNDCTRCNHNFNRNPMCRINDEIHSVSIPSHIRYLFHIYPPKEKNENKHISRR